MRSKNDTANHGVEPIYLGDGAYASFDGFSIWVTLETHDRNEATTKICLEPEVAMRLFAFRERCKLAARDHYAREAREAWEARDA